MNIDEAEFFEKEVQKFNRLLRNPYVFVGMVASATFLNYVSIYQKINPEATYEEAVQEVESYFGCTYLEWAERQTKEQLKKILKAMPKIPAVPHVRH